MSHEIRTPLNALVGFSRLLADENTTKEEAEQYNDIIKLNSDLLLKLINDVVDVSTLDVNKMYFNIESTELIGLCYKTIDFTHRYLQTTVIGQFAGGFHQAFSE